MPIRFHCSGCQYLLQVPDDAAGKKARCPRCQNVADVPLVSAVVEGATGINSGGVNPPSPDDDPYRLAPEEKLPSPPPSWAASKPLGPLPTKPLASDNPYQSPSYSYDEPKYGASHYGTGDKQPIYPTRIVLEEVFRHGWNIYQQNFAMMLGVGVVVFGAEVIRGAISGGIEEVLEGERYARLAANGFELVTWPLIVFLQIGMAIVYLKIARGQPVEFGELFSGGKYFLRSLGGDFLWNVMLVLGICALIVPGIFVALMLWPFYLFIIDRDQGVFESFSSAQQFTDGNKATMFIVGLANIGIMLLGCLALGIGMIFAYPLVSMLLVVSYLMMTGQFYKRV